MFKKAGWERFRIAAVLFLAATVLSGCQTMGPKQGVGTVAGAGVGALFGSMIGGGTGKMVAVGAGTLLGSMLGSEVGASLDRADMIYANRAAATAFETAPTNQRIAWQNPDSGNYGYVAPTRTFQDNYGSVCREFVQTIYVGGRAQQGRGRACRSYDGSWEIQ